MMILKLKSLILINFIKNNRLAASTLPGVTLTVDMPPAARCAGAKWRRKYWEKPLKLLDIQDLQDFQNSSDIPNML